MDPILMTERIFTAMTARHTNSDDHPLIIEGLRNLADCLEREGFLPYLDAETGLAYRGRWRREQSR